MLIKSHPTRVSSSRFINQTPRRYIKLPLFYLRFLYLSMNYTIFHCHISSSKQITSRLFCISALYFAGIIFREFWEFINLKLREDLISRTFPLFKFGKDLFSQISYFLYVTIRFPLDSPSEKITFAKKKHLRKKSLS